MDKMRFSQIEFTHPGMYKFFGVDREADHNASLARGNDVLRQVAAGLLMFDVRNRTIRDHLFVPWSECALNPACLSPGWFDYVVVLFVFLMIIFVFACRQLYDEYCWEQVANFSTFFWSTCISCSS